MKKFFATLLVGAVLVLGALPAWAADLSGTVTMEAKGDQAQVTLSLPEGADQSATALQLTFQVEGGDAKAEFLFDQGITSSVQEYQYDQDKEQLTVYLAGKQPLFQNGTLKLGTIQLRADKGASATVSLVEDSLELVNAAYGKGQDTAVSGGAVTLTVEGSSSPQPDHSGNGNSSQSGNQGSVPAVETPAATPQPTAGNQSSTGKPGATAAPSQSPEPSGEPAEEETPFQPQQDPQPTQAPEEAQPAPAEKSGPSPLLILGAAAVVILMGGLVVFFRRR